VQTAASTPFVSVLQEIFTGEGAGSKVRVPPFEETHEGAQVSGRNNFIPQGIIHSGLKHKGGGETCVPSCVLTPEPNNIRNVLPKGRTQIKGSVWRAKQVKTMVKLKINTYTSARGRKLVRQQRKNYKIESSSWHNLPVNDAFGLTEGGKIHLGVRADKLSNGILEPLTISVSNIVRNLRLCLFEGPDCPSQRLGFLSQLALNSPQKDLALCGPLLQIGHFALQFGHQILELDCTGMERQDLRF